MLSGILKNKYNLYYKSSIEDLGLPFFNFRETPQNYYSKTRLQTEFKINLTEEQLNTPHAFARGQNGYYPVWDINNLV